MRDVTEPTYGPSYQDLIDSFEAENLLQVDDHGYEGDSRVLLRDGQRYGLLFFGWGSCSGCDALEAAGSQTAVTKLRDDMWESIHWADSAADLLAYVNGKDWSLDYGYYAEQKQFLAQVRDLLTAEAAK